MTKLLAGVAALALFSTPVFAAQLDDHEPDFDPARLAAHIKVLASDAFEGRGPATPGEAKSVAYIAGQFKAAGLQPGGDKTAKGRAWTQAVPLVRFTPAGPVKVSVTAGGQTMPWTQGEQIAVRAAQTGVAHVAVKDAPVVFVGYGVTAPERQWDDFKGYDLKGKIALVLVNDPDFETGSDGAFGGKAMTYYGRWTYKYEEAARRGAVGFIVIHETAPASYGWNTVKNSNTGEVFDIVRKDPAEAHAPVEAWVQRDAAVSLFQKAGLDFEALKKQAQTRDFKPVALTGVTFSTDFTTKIDKVVSRNVVAVLPGKIHPSERIIYTAHWDHLGIGLPDAKGDRIYNGAQDNAAGVAELIEWARAFARAPRTERSVVFMAVTAEEKGLLGSEYYAANPLYPLATTVANINVDDPQAIGAARDISSRGSAPLSLQDDLIAIAKAHGRDFSPDPDEGAGRFYRSDHFSFAKRGVPAISPSSGQDLIKGGKAAGKAAVDAYIRDRYHQPADQLDDTWDMSGFAPDMVILYDLGRQLANSHEWPVWKQGAEFKAARDASAAARK